MILKYLKILIPIVLVVIILLAYTLYTRIDDEIIQDTPKYSQKEMGEAIIHFNQSGKYEEALVLADEYMKLYPNDLEGWVHHGYANLKLGNCSEASADFYHASVNGNKFADTLISSVSNSNECGVGDSSFRNQ